MFSDEFAPILISEVNTSFSACNSSNGEQILTFQARKLLNSWWS